MDGWIGADFFSIAANIQIVLSFKTKQTFFTRAPLCDHV